MHHPLNVAYILTDLEADSDTLSAALLHDTVHIGKADLNDIEKEFGVPIINKRVSVTPAALIAGGFTADDAVKLAKTLDKAAKKCGVNFIGGFSALVQKGMTKGDETESAMRENHPSSICSAGTRSWP